MITALGKVVDILDICNFYRRLILPIRWRYVESRERYKSWVLLTPYPAYKIQFNKKRGAQTDQNSVSLFFYAFLEFDPADGYVQLHCL